MKLFKDTNKPYYEFNYGVGEPVEVLIGRIWELYEVGQYDDGEMYLEPWGFTYNSNRISTLNKFKIRQTPQTFLKARKIFLQDIQDLQEAIDHKIEKDNIKKIQARLKNLVPKHGGK